MAEQIEQLVGSGDLVRLFGVPLSTLKRLDRAGILPASRRVANRRVWSSDQIEVIESALEARRDGRRQIDSGKAAK